MICARTPSLVLAALAAGLPASAAIQASRPAPSTVALEYRMVKVPGTEYLLPTITRLADRRVQGAINRRLAKVATEARCDEEEAHLDLEAEVAYHGQGFFSVHVTQMCTVYPAMSMEEDRSLTFDLGTGEVVSFFDLFGEAVKSETIAEAAFPYQLAVARAGRDPAAARAGRGDDECLSRYTLRNLADSLLTFFFSEEGLVLRPDWGVTAHGCADQVTAPYRVLAPLAAAGGPLARIAAAHPGAAARYRVHRPGGDPKEDVFYDPKEADIRLKN